MNNYSIVNKKWWNDVTYIHSKSKLYNLKGFEKGHTSLFDIEIQELKNIKKKSLLHLMCHFGMDTLSFAREGAKTTGVDLSDTSINLAKKLSKDLNIQSEFICSDIFDLKKFLHKKYDIVYTSYGVLCWISDINKWAKIINDYLKPGGRFYMVELHPFTSILSYDFKFEYDYFDKGPFEDRSSGTYTDWDADIKGITYEWHYTISDVINALIKQNLKIEFIHEFPYTMYNQFPGFMTKNKKGQYFLKSKKYQIPLLFSIMAKNA